MEATLDQPTVLIVEDDEQIAFLLQFIVEREGFRVLLARDGRAAQKLIDESVPPALSMLDVMLPYVDGFQLIAHIRAKPAWRDSPILMLTAKSQEGEIVRALDAGANDYLVKPFQPNELKARIRRLVSPKP